MSILPARAGTLCVLAVTSSCLAMSACVAPSAARPVIAHQREALLRARAAYQHDLDLLQSQVAAAMSARETLLRGEAHRELIAKGHITPSLEADFAAFDRDLANPEARTSLLTEVRLGRLTREQAHDFLSDYALTLKMKREGRPVREAMIARLAALEEANRSRTLINESLRSRRESVLRLLDDAAESNAALDDFATRASPDDDPTFAEPAQAWREVLERLTSAPSPSTP
jgi:hypothetical protein